MTAADPLEPEASRADGEAELTVTGLYKTFGGTPALQDVSLTVHKGEVHALLGGNGSGKSTLIKILAGVYQGDAGVLEVAGHRVNAGATSPSWAYAAGLRFVHQDTGVFLEHTVAENFALGSSYGGRSVAKINWRSLNRRVTQTLERFELDVAPSARMGSLRKADQTLVAVARALDGQARSSVLILDEPTASLPPHEVDQVHAAIRGYIGMGHTVILVSHRVDDILAVATHATFLRDGRRIASHSIEGMDELAILARMAEGGADEPSARRTKSAPAPAEPLLRVRGLASGVLQDVSFDLHPGEILGIAGLAGSGRSTLLRSIAALTPRRSGELILDGTTLGRLHPDQAIARGIAYVPEDRLGDASFRERSVRENLLIPRVHTFWRLWMRRRSEQTATRHAIARYGVIPAAPDAMFSTLSGGNQQKVVMARWLELAPRVILLDEPTQGVDVGARRALHEQVRAAADRGVGVILVSSDARELAQLSDRVISLRAGRVSTELQRDAITLQTCVEAAYGPV